jgi:hypothetical protein
MSIGKEGVKAILNKLYTNMYSSIVIEGNKFYKTGNYLGEDIKVEFSKENEVWKCTINYNKDGSIVIDNFLDTYQDYNNELLKTYLINFKNSGGSLRSSRSSRKPVKTSRTYKGKDGVTRVLYKRDQEFYVKKKSEKTGKFTYRKVKV